MSITRLRVAAVLGIACLVLAATPRLASAKCTRIVAVGDLHGGYDAFVTILREARLIDDKLGWAGGKACLVQLGDIVDRGSRSREILDLLMALETQAKGRVHVLLGNHEAMTMLSDLRYVHPDEYTAFAAEETQDERALGYREFQTSEECHRLNGDAREKIFALRYPPGWFARRRAFSPEGSYGSWLLERPVVLRLGKTLFVHGGLSARDSLAGLEAINRRVKRQFLEYFKLRGSLVEAGVVHPLSSFEMDFMAVDAWLFAHEQRAIPQVTPKYDVPTGVVARDFLALVDALFIRSDGPLWDRQFALADEPLYGSTVQRIMRQVDVERIVVGHSLQGSTRIRARFGSRVFLIDTGAGPAYGGRVSALEIKGNEVRAIYIGEVETLVRTEPAAAVDGAAAGRE